MPSAKIVFRVARPYKDGTCPVMLRVIANRVAKEIQLCRVRPRDWNLAKCRVRTSHPDHEKLNTLITDRLRKAEDGLDDAKQKITLPVAETVINAQRPVTGSYLDLVQAYIDARKAQGKLHTAEKYGGNLTILKLYLKNTGKKQGLMIHEVTESFILHFIRWERNRGTSPNTLNRRLEFFRSVLATHCEQEARKGRFVYNPFEGEQCRVSRVKTRKVRLTPTEVAALENLILPINSRKHHARLCWLFQYYMRGIRISDALMMKPENIVNDRVEFTTIKAPTFHSVRVHPKLKTLLEQLLAFKRPYLLPLMTWQPDPNKTADDNHRAMWRQIEAKTQIVNKNLKLLENELGLNKPLRSHISRHTFAREADSRLDDKRAIQGMLGHTSFKMTETYLDDLRDDSFDDYADEVFAAQPEPKRRRRGVA